MCFYMVEHAGLVLVRLLPSEQDVSVPEQQLSEPGMSGHRMPVRGVTQSDEKGRAPTKPQENKHRLSSDEHRGGPPGQYDVAHTHVHHNCSPSNLKGSVQSSFKARTWLREGIRVRIVDKDVAGGRLYLKKAYVVSVPGHQCCDIHMDDGSHREVVPLALMPCRLSRIFMKTR
jgi:hypothetical protein